MHYVQLDFMDLKYLVKDNKLLPSKKARLAPIEQIIMEGYKNYFGLESEFNGLLDYPTTKLTDDADVIVYCNHLLGMQWI